MSASPAIRTAVITNQLLTTHMLDSNQAAASPLLQPGERSVTDAAAAVIESNKRQRSPTLQTTVVQSVRHEYDEVYSFTVRDEAEKTPYKAGQYCHLLAPGIEWPGGNKGKGGGKGGGKGNHKGKKGKDEKMVRHMSFASSPLESELIFSMDLSSRSSFKQKFAGLKLGDKMQFFKVKGEFTLPADATDVVFIAGGIGITPIRSLILDIEQGGKPISWRLLHVARSAHLYQEELELFESPQRRTDRRGAPAGLSAILEQSPASHYFVSGSDGFVRAQKQQLSMLGICETRILCENFH